MVVERLTRDGVRDRRFGDDGDVRFRYPGRAEAGAGDVLVDPNGRIVVAGWATKDAGYEGNVVFALARLTPNGTLDAAFGRGGKSTAKVGPYRMDLAASITRTVDGRLVVVGSSQENTYLTPTTDPRVTGHFASKFVVSRFEAGGALDRSFGEGGHSTVEFGPDGAAADVAIAPDGTLVVVGSVLVKAGELIPEVPDQLIASDFAVARWAPGW
jgi:uncharacterized delta-60 repeat protein